MTPWRLAALGIALAVGLAVLGAATVLLEDEERELGTPRVPSKPAAGRVHTLLSSVASQLVGHEVTVRCWPPSAWRDIVGRRLVRAEFGGLAGIGSERDAVQLAPAVCGSLDRLTSARVRGKPPVGAALAVGVLSHEATHLDDDRPGSEAGVECHGMQRIRQAARLLGLRGSGADRLAALYLAEVYPRNPPRYRSSECRDGGKLDVRPRSKVWP